MTVWKITILNRRYIFIHGGVFIVILVFECVHQPTQLLKRKKTLGSISHPSPPTFRCTSAKIFCLGTPESFWKKAGKKNKMFWGVEMGVETKIIWVSKVERVQNDEYVNQEFMTGRISSRTFLSISWKRLNSLVFNAYLSWKLHD